jgi:serine/threonine-protein kinase
VQELERAVNLDSTFAAAYARLAEAYANIGYFGYSGTLERTEAFGRAEAALQKAMVLDPSRAETQLARAKLGWMHLADLVGAERAIHRALADSPSFAEAHFEHARLLAIRQHADSAAAEVRLAAELDPTTSIRYADVAWVHWIVRRYDDAVASAQRAIRLDSTSSTAYLALGGAYVGLGRYPDAIEAFEEGLKQSRGNRLFLPQLGHAYARAGRHVEANRVLDDLRALHARALVGPYYVAQVHIGLDQRDSALVWLEKAAKQRSGHLVFLRANAVWDPLRSSLRFQRIERSIRLDGNGPVLSVTLGGSP